MIRTQQLPNITAAAAGLGYDIEYVKPKIVEGRAIFSVKFLCGPLIQTVAFSPFVPALYLSAVNVHNLSNRDLTFKKKVVLAFPQRSEERGPISPIVKETLGPNQALEIDCRDIGDLIGIPQPSNIFFTGFLVIETDRRNAQKLQVVSVNTALHKQEHEGLPSIPPESTQIMSRRQIVLRTKK